MWVICEPTPASLAYSSWLSKWPPVRDVHFTRFSALSIALAYILWYYGIRHLGSSRTAVYSNTVPVVALLVAWLTLGEVPTGVQVAGTVMILGGIGLARLQRRPAEVPEDEVPPE